MISIVFIGFGIQVETLNKRYQTYCIDPPIVVHAAKEAEGVMTVVTVTLQTRSAKRRMVRSIWRVKAYVSSHVTVVYTVAMVCFVLVLVGVGAVTVTMLAVLTPL